MDEVRYEWFLRRLNCSLHTLVFTSFIQLEVFIFFCLTFFSSLFYIYQPYFSQKQGLGYIFSVTENMEGLLGKEGLFLSPSFDLFIEIRHMILITRKRFHSHWLTKLERPTRPCNELTCGIQIKSSNLLTQSQHVVFKAPYGITHCYDTTSTQQGVLSEEFIVHKCLLRYYQSL